MIGQLSIDGEELTGHQIALPGLGVKDWPENEELKRGFRVIVTSEYVVTHVQDGAAADANAVPKETVKRTYITTLDKSSVKVTEILQRQSKQGAA